MYRSLGSFVLLALLPACVWAAKPETSFTVQNQLQAPGQTLSAGRYSLSLEENILHDRTIVRLRNATGSVNTLLLAVPDVGLNSARPGVIDTELPSHSERVLRGWVLPGKQGALEFAYPKEEAAKLANALNRPVLAVDPVSDKLPPLPSMTQDDMKIVHLWLLDYQKVGPDGSGKLTATAYKPSEGKEMAANMPPASKLPRTGGHDYQWMLIGFSLLIASFLVRVARSLFSKRG